MLTRAVFSAGEKALYCVVVAGVIGFFVWMNVAMWRKIRDARKKK